MHNESINSSLCQYILVDRNGEIIDRSSELTPCVAIRSCAKPFQLLPIYLLGLNDAYQFSEKEITIMASSMLGQDVQVETVSGLLDKTGVLAEELSLRPTAPSGKIAFANWKAEQSEESVLYHPCIGNHIAMFLAQRALTGSGKDYLSPSSEVQRLILKLITELCFGKEQKLQIMQDSCGAPTYLVSMYSLATGYRQLCMDSSNRYHAYIRLMRQAFSQYPVFLEGEGCLSTILTAHAGIVGKTGAGGILGMGLDSPGIGVALYSPSNRWADVAYTAQKVLLKLGWKDDMLIHDLQEVRRST